MGLFDKVRTGVLERLDPGPRRRRFAWIIPNFQSLPQGTYDSPKDKSFDNVSFHFHLVIGERWDIGFYMHYKQCPMPKYSFYFSALVPAPGQATPRRLRQHTAHSIPPETERCGHWNVCSMSDCMTLVQDSGSMTLKIVMEFDDDTVGLEDGNVDSSVLAAMTGPAAGATSGASSPSGMTRTPSSPNAAMQGPSSASSENGNASLTSVNSQVIAQPSFSVFHAATMPATRVLWKINQMWTTRFAPLTSRSFAIETNPLVIRIDRLTEDDPDLPYNVFIFARTNLVPRHRIFVFNGVGETLAADDESVLNAETPAHVLKMPAAAIDRLRAAGPTSCLIVVVLVCHGNNPLDFFTRAREVEMHAVASVSADSPLAGSTRSIGAESGAQYHLMSDDL